MKKDESKSSKIVNRIGLSLVVIAYAGAILNMLNVKREQTWTDKKVLRITHWQLEAGFRESMDWVIKEYEKIHPDVKIIQQPIYERAYKQYMNTQLVGGTAPDIIELGMFTGGQGGEQNVMGRYFLPLTEHVYKVNPYNADNEFATTPWINTFKAKLQSNWDNRNLEYYSIGVTIVNGRFVYNKSLFKKIIGHEEPPQTFDELLEACKKVEAYSEKTGETIFPIASSNTQVKEMSTGIRSRMLTNYIPLLDEDYNWERDHREMFFGWLTGLYSFDDKELEMTEKMLLDVAEYFEPGFMAKGRMEAALSFVQQKSLIINAGTWDVTSLRLQAKDAGFELGAFKFPPPSPDNPEYGKYYDGQSAESAQTWNGPFGLCRYTKYPEVAVDFLMFFSSKRIAEGFCKRAGWLCGIRNTDNVDYIKPFEPDFSGTKGDGRSLFEQGYRTIQRFRQTYWDFISGKATWEEFLSIYMKDYPRYVTEDFMQMLQGYDGNLLGLSQGYSSNLLRLNRIDDPKLKEKVFHKYLMRADAYATQYSNLMGNSVKMRHQIEMNSGPRVDLIKNTRAYKLFLDEFVHNQ